MVDILADEHFGICYINPFCFCSGLNYFLAIKVLTKNVQNSKTNRKTIEWRQFCCFYFQLANSQFSCSVLTHDLGFVLLVAILPLFDVFWRTKLKFLLYISLNFYSQIYYHIDFLQGIAEEISFIMYNTTTVIVELNCLKVKCLALTIKFKLIHYKLILPKWKLIFLCNMFLLKHVIEEPIFDILRTKEQLGYEKFSLAWKYFSFCQILRKRLLSKLFLV